ncbi:MAG TPA: succinyl-diaminopimelate desuccinylase [Acidimicrobiales bacterium]|nr:succinyl-diaminopimelate desuccinylase [Acidimicrobiales bacterium]
MTDLLASTAALVAIPSESHEEARLATHVEERLRALGRLDVERVDDNVVARTHLGRPMRLVLAGHLDTVPANDNASPRVEGDVLWGLGSTDMKGGLAVMLALAEAVPDPAVDVTWVFYAAEEVAAVHNGLRHLFEHRPDLLVGDAALLGEPTAADLEVGCQGTMRLRVTLAGARAHPARPWMGRNAIHRAGRVLAALDDYEARRPVLDGCEFHEALQALSVEGGVAGNVVPDRAVITINHRFAPDRTPSEAQAHVEEVLSPHLEDGDEVELVDVADAAPPALTHPLLATLRERNGLAVRAKLGWTDVSRFAAAGIPAANFGPGESSLAHTRDEHVDRASLDAVYAALVDLISRGV